MKAGSTNLARQMITEVTRRVYLDGIRLAMYTGATEMPDVLSRAHYYHRKLNVAKLVACGFSSLPRGKTISQMKEEYDLPQEHGVKGLRAMRREDASSVVSLLKMHHEGQGLWRQWDEATVRHTLLPRRGVIFSWVVESEGNVTDLISFYSVPSLILGEAERESAAQHAAEALSAEGEAGTTAGAVNNAYLYYTVATSMPRPDLIRAGLILAKEMGFDAFTALGIGGLPQALKEPQCNFTIGTGILRYYLFNWQGLAKPEELIGFVAL